ncbi:MAG: hypothetical protein ABIE74_02655 [Pseudomonadota bacterium]
MAIIGKLFPKYFGTLQKAMSETQFSSLAPQLDSFPKDGVDLQRASQILSEITHGIAARSPAFGSVLMNHAAHAESVKTVGAMYDVINYYTKAMSRMDEYREGRNPPISFDRFRALMLKINSEEDQFQWFKEGLQRLGVSHPDQVLVNVPINRGRLYLCSIFLMPGEGNRFSIDIDFQSNAHYKISIAFPASVKSLSEDDLQLIAARGLLFQALKDFVPRELKAGLTSFSQREITKIPSGVYLFPKIKNFSERRMFATEDYLKGGRNFDGLYDILLWFLQLKQVNESIGTSKTTGSTMQRFRGDLQFAFCSSEYLSLRVPDEKMAEGYEYWYSLFTDMRLADTVFQPSQCLLSPPYYMLLKLVKGNSITIASRPLPEKRGTYIDFEIGNSIFSRMEPIDFVKLIWRATVVVKNAQKWIPQNFEADKNPPLTQKGVTHDYRYFQMSGLLFWELDILKDRKDRGGIETITLEQLREGDALIEDEKKQFARLKLLFEHFQFSKSGGITPNKIQIQGDLKAISQRYFATALKVVGAHLKTGVQDSVQAVLENLLKGRTWLFGETGESRNTTIVEVSPSTDTTFVMVEGDSMDLNPRDWLFTLAAIAANGDRPIRVGINAAHREIVLGGYEKLVLELYSSVASMRLYDSFGCFDPKVKAPKDIDLELPGGVSASLNSNLDGASAEQRKGYIKALRWFSMSDVPDKWQPRANESETQIKKKYRAMMMAWHFDRGEATPDQINLATSAQPHWDAVLNMHKAK